MAKWNCCELQLCFCRTIFQIIPRLLEELYNLLSFIPNACVQLLSKNYFSQLKEMLVLHICTFLHNLSIICYKLLCSLGTVIIAWKLEEGLTRQTLKKRIIMGTKKATTIKPHRAAQCSVCRFCASWLSLTVPLHSRQFDIMIYLNRIFVGLISTQANVTVY